MLFLQRQESHKKIEKQIPAFSGMTKTKKWKTYK